MVHRRIGCTSPRTMLQVGADVWFLSDSGVRSRRRVIESSNAEVDEATISAPIQDVIERINWSVAGLFAAAYWRNRYLLSVALDDATQPNTLLVYNTLTRSWSGIWTGWNATCFCNSFLSNAVRLVFGDTAATVRNWLDYVLLENEVDATFTDAGEPVPAKLVTRSLTWGEGVSDKHGQGIEWEWNGSDEAAAVTLIFDTSNEADAGNIPTSDATDLTLPFVLPAMLPRSGLFRNSVDLMRYNPFRELQISMETQGGKLSLRGLNVSAFLDAHDWETSNYGN
jgi:hypothetical protein